MRQVLRTASLGIGGLLFMSLVGCLNAGAPPVVNISPPEWIQGVWVTAFDLASLTFTEDNVILHFKERPGNPTETIIDFRKAYARIGLTDRVYGTRWPTYEIVKPNGERVLKCILWNEKEALFGEPYLEVSFGGVSETLRFYRQ